MEFGEFGRFFVQLGKLFFGWFVVDTRIDEVPEDANQNEWTDEGRVENGPHDDANDARTDQAEIDGIGDNLGNGTAIFISDFNQRIAEAGHDIRESLKNKIANAKEDTTNHYEGNQTDAKDAAEVFQ